jgi:hypothetical protein
MVPLACLKDPHPSAAIPPLAPSIEKHNGYPYRATKGKGAGFPALAPWAEWDQSPDRGRHLDLRSTGKTPGEPRDTHRTRRRRRTRHTDHTDEPHNHTGTVPNWDFYRYRCLFTGTALDGVCGVWCGLWRRVRPGVWVWSGAVWVWSGARVGGWVGFEGVRFVRFVCLSRVCPGSPGVFLPAPPVSYR